MDAELSAALVMFDGLATDDLHYQRERLRAVHAANSPVVPRSLLVRDILPGPPQGPPVRVRWYQPKASPGPGPVLLWLHGGAFTYGFPEIDDDFCLRLAVDAGIRIASPDYRLSPEHPFPAAFEDAYATLTWLRGQADALGVEPHALAVGGSSAGGALAAGVCLRARDECVPGIRLQILACPVIDNRLATPSMARFSAAPIFTSHEAARMWQRYLGENRDDPPRYAVPGRELELSGLPPTYVLTADEDPLRDEGIDYAVRLIAAGNQVELHHVPGTFHSFDIIAPTAAVSQRVYGDYLAALSRAYGT